MTVSGAGSTVPRSAYNRWRYVLYLVPFLVCPMVIFVVAFLVIPTDWFADRSNNLFMDTLGYGAALHNADCKVAIYGDSTAILGVTPSLVRQYTGLSTCNVAEVAGVNLVNGTMPLDQFLAQNPRPQFLVFLFAPEAFNPASLRYNPDITTFEGVTYRMRQPHKVAGFFALMRHPEDVFSWVDHGVRMSIDDIFLKPFPPDVKYTRFRTMGQTGFRNPPLTSCNYPHHNPVPDRTWVNGLRKKYGVDGTTVIFDATPVPACDPDLEFFRQQLHGLIDNSFQPLPMQDYYGGGRHVYPSGAALISKEISDQILDRLNSNARSGAQ
jgi:hypothetical protein